MRPRKRALNRHLAFPFLFVVDSFLVCEHLLVGACKHVGVSPCLSASVYHNRSLGVRVYLTYAVCVRMCLHVCAGAFTKA